MSKNFIKLAEEKIRKAAFVNKETGKTNVKKNILTSIFFELNPGVDELSSGYEDLRKLANNMNITVV